MNFTLGELKAHQKQARLILAILYHSLSLSHPEMGRGNDCTISKAFLEMPHHPTTFTKYLTLTR